MPFELEADARAHLDGQVVHDLPMTRRRRQTLLTSHRGDDAAIVLFDRRTRRRRWVDRAVFVATDAGWVLDSIGRFDRSPDVARPDHPRAPIPLDSPGDHYRCSTRTGSGLRVGVVVMHEAEYFDPNHRSEKSDHDARWALDRATAAIAAVQSALS